MSLKISKKLLELADDRGHIISEMMNLRHPINHHLLKILFFKHDGTVKYYFNKWVGEITSKLVRLGSLITKKTFKYIDRKTFIQLVFKGFYEDTRYVDIFIVDEMEHPEEKLTSPFILKYSLKGNTVDENGIREYIKKHLENIELFFADIGDRLESGDFDMDKRKVPKEERERIIRKELTPLVEKQIRTYIPDIPEFD